MIYRRLGKAGIQVSAVSLGGWLTFGDQIDQEATRAVVVAAIDSGVNFIDLADAYAGGRAEQVFGNILRDFPRQELVVSSKAYWPTGEGPNQRGLSRKHLFESIDATLRRLGTDYIDLYFCHRHDEGVEMEEVVMTMDDLVHQGKVLYWGTSVWPVSRQVEAAYVARHLRAHAPSAEQPRYNMFDRHIETEIVPTAARLGVGLVVWSPLAHGVLSGKYATGVPDDSRAAKFAWVRRGLKEEDVAKVQELVPIAKELGASTAQLALAWCLRLPEVTSVISGASKPEQIRENVGALGLTLDDDVLESIESVLQNRPAPLPS